MTAGPKGIALVEEVVGHDHRAREAEVRVTLFLVVIANAEAAAAIQSAGGKQLIPHAWVIEAERMEDVQMLAAGSAHVVFDVTQAPHFAASNIGVEAADLLKRNAG